MIVVADRRFPMPLRCDHGHPVKARHEVEDCFGLAGFQKDGRVKARRIGLVCSPSSADERTGAVGVRARLDCSSHVSRRSTVRAI